MTGAVPAAAKRPFRWVPAAGLVVWAFLPWLLSGRLSLSIFIFIFLYATIAIGLNLLAGYAGQVSLGQAAFYGLGAYLTGILSVHAGWSPWLSFPAAVAGTALLAYGVGAPILMLRGHYLVVGTLGFNIIVTVLFRQLHDLTGGPSGLTGIPAFTLGGQALRGNLVYYYASGLLMLGAAWASANLIRSRFGRALQAIHASETAAESAAINPTRHKLLVFVWSAALAAAAGAMYAHYVTFISPSPFGFEFSVQLLMMAVIGGIASVPGAVLGAALAVLLREGLGGVVPLLVGQSSAEYEIVVFGVLLAAVVILSPEGLWPRLVAWLAGITWAVPPSAGEPSPGVTADPDPVRPLPGEAGDSASPPAVSRAPEHPTPATGPLLRVEGLTRRFGGLVAVRDLSFTVQPGEIFAIMGPNGAGKTTLFNMISGVLRPTAGRIELQGRRIDGLPAHRVARLGVARTFQTPRLFPLLTAVENVMVGLHQHQRAGFVASALRLTRNEERAARSRALAALAQVGGEELASQRVDALPFGALRMIELARALAARPRLLLLDEPASGLTGPERQELARLIRRVRDAGVAVVLVEHDVPFLMQLADRVLVVHHGEAIAQGLPEEVRRNPRVIAAYLGEEEQTGAGGPAPGPGVHPDSRVESAGGAAEAVLEVSGLSAGYGRVPVLRDVAFRVRAGEIVAVLGSNGAGKTTLMRAVTGLLPASGSVRFRGRELLGLPAERIAALGVALVPERRQLFETMSVEDHLILGAYTRFGRRGSAGIRDDIRRVYDLFPILYEKRNQLARSLSGGQQQMLAIGRALMARPQVLLLDEPLLGLAPLVVADILAVIRRMRDDGLAVVLVEQNAATVLPACDRAYVLDIGRIALSGEARSLRRAPELQAVFLGGAVGGEVRR
ncbi:MAG TPA: ATP-binding cassette domain-containing protein [Bacillota bacterium]